MQTHRFVKEENKWFIDLPAYIEAGGNKGDLQMVEGADTMLDLIAGSEPETTITMHDAPFEGADEIVLLEICDPAVGGGIYLLKTFENKLIEQPMWLCAVTGFVFGELPPRIFVKRVVI